MTSHSLVISDAAVAPLGDMTTTTTTAADASSSSNDSGRSTITLPIRFQCPLCFDVLRRPVLLPCCRRHLCLACFERALELTSANCGFCRKRIVGYARTTQHKVDTALWNEIVASCPSIRAALVSDATIDDVEFVDALAPVATALQRAASQSLRPGELKQMYDEQQRAYATQLAQSQAQALAQTMRFLQSDPEYQASMAPSLQSATVTTVPTSDKSQSATAVSLNQKQQRLDSFFSAPTLDLAAETDAAEVSPLTPEPPRKRVRVVPNSSSSSALAPTRTSPRRRRQSAAVVQTTLLQLVAPGATSKPTASTARRRLDKGAATPRRTPWRCVQCTFENSCFDRQCSMCHAARPAVRAK